MASLPGAGGPRHAGRIVDPLAADDGDAAFSETTSDVFEPPVASAATGGVPVSSRHPVRERLLARAASARSASIASEPDSRGRDETELLTSIELELDRVGSPRPPAAPVRGRRKALPPTVVAAFGTLVGLVLVASLVALGMHMDPRRKPAAVATPPATTANADDQKADAPVVPRRQRKRVPGPWRIADAKSDASVRVVEGQIGQKPFLRAVQDAGLPKKEAYRILKAMTGLRNLDKCDRNDRFAALLERGSGRLRAFEYSVSLEEIYQARENESGILAAKKLDLAVERAQVSGAVQYTGKSFADDAVRGGFEPQLDKALDKALEGHLSLDQLERGDVLRVVAQEVTVLGEFARYAGIEAVEVRPAKGEGLRVYYLRGPTSRGYYDQRGRALFDGGWRKPIKDAPITSRFNPKRLHPVLKKVMPHTGTDFGAPSGTPVGASSFGTVSFMGWAGASGNLVKIDHPGGVETGYAHLSRFAEGLKVGDKVKRMQLVGYVGSTGRSTGPHLHFSAKRGNEFFDPETLNLDSMRVLPAQERPLFDEAKRKYDALLDVIRLPPPLEPASAPSPDPAAVAQEPAHEDEPDLLAEQPVKPAAVPAPAPAPAASAAAATRPAVPSAAAVYLTDKELLKLQGTADDGEVTD